MAVWPRRCAFAALVVLITCLAHPSPASAQDPTVSLSAYTAYSVQRKCVRDCLIGPHNDGNPGVIRELCGWPMLQSCYCGTAIAAAVSSEMTNCIDDYCSSKTADLSAALSLYDHYCAGDLTFITSAATVSLASDRDMLAQKSCVQGCMMSRPRNGGANLPMALLCTTGPVYNDCLCRPDLTADVNSHLTTCVNSFCSGNAADITAAISLYGSYCLAARQPAPTDGSGDAGEGGSQTTASPGGSGTNGQPRETESNGGTNPSTPSGGGLSTGEVIAIVAGVVAAFLAAAAAASYRLRHRRPKPAPTAPLLQPGPQFPPHPPPIYTPYPPVEAHQMSPYVRTPPVERNPMLNPWLREQSLRSQSPRPESIFSHGDGRTDILSNGRPY